MFEELFLLAFGCLLSEVGLVRKYSLKSENRHQSSKSLKQKADDRQLKAKKLINRYKYFYTDISSHIVNALSASCLVHIQILQSTLVTLISIIQ